MAAESAVCVQAGVSQEVEYRSDSEQKRLAFAKKNSRLPCCDLIITKKRKRNTKCWVKVKYVAYTFFNTYRSYKPININ